MRRFLTLICLFSATVHAKESLCLNMIVKNEAHVIKKCLDSLKGKIDYWVIVDTGSTDGTQELIKEELKEIPGELHQSTWKNFGYNRSEAFNLAKGKGDYILFMDADDWLEYEEDFNFASLNKDSYQMWRGTSDFTYLKPQLVKGHLPWRWVGVTHEYLTCDQIHSQGILQGVRYVSGDNGASRNDPEKFMKNVHLLEEGLKEEPTNARYMFYLAESYRDAGNPLKAIESYHKRIAMGGWEEEIFWSLLQIAKLENQLKVPMDMVAEDFHKAHRLRPHRVEPVYYMAELYNQNHRYDLAYECMKGWNFILKPASKDSLFNEAWMEQWGLTFQLSICSYYLGHFQESLDLCNLLLDEKYLPEHLKELVEKNRTFPLQKLPHIAENRVSSEAEVKA